MGSRGCSFVSGGRTDQPEPQPPSTCTTMLGLTPTLAVAALLGTTSAQLFNRCPRYQSTVNFNQAFIDKMTALNSGGYIVRFSNGATDACQRLQFVDGNDHNVTFIDAANYQQNYTNRYSYTLATPSGPAYLHLKMHPRLLGADSNGNLVLYPLVARNDLLAFVSCIEPSITSLYMTEQVLVFTPYKTKNTLSDAQIKKILTQHKVPRINELKNISTNCIPPPPTADNPLSVDIYNLISNIVNPFGGVSNVALTYGSPNQAPAEAAEQLMRMFEEAGVSPAQFYAQTGSAVFQNSRIPPSIPTSDQVSYNAFQKAAGIGRSPHFNYDPALHAAAVAVNSQSYHNYNPAYPLQHLFNPFQQQAFQHHQNTLFRQPSVHHGTQFAANNFGTKAADQYAHRNVNPTVTTYTSGMQQPQPVTSNAHKLHHHHHQTTSSTSKQQPSSATVYSAISNPQPIAYSSPGAQNIYYKV